MGGGSSRPVETLESVQAALKVMTLEAKMAKQEAERMKKEKKKTEEEKQKIEEKQRRAEEESLKKERQRVEERIQQLEKTTMMQKDYIKIQEENKRAQEENKRAQEEFRRVQDENRRIQEEHRKTLEEMRIEEERRRMDEVARKIEENARRRVEEEVCLRKQAEEYLERGVPAVKYPTGQDIYRAKAHHNYQEGNLHFAITGVSGSGKSSLINAFRGVKNGSKGAAKTGTIETTQKVSRYRDPNRKWMYWYDVPGAGTLKVPDWQYFNDQGLYIFDILVIAIDIRFTKIDVALLLHCKRFGIPAFVVRSKANQHITNTMNDNNNGDKDDDDNDSRDGDSEDGNDDDVYDFGDDSKNNGNSESDNENSQELYERARNKFITSTREEYHSILATIGLPQQNVYIVSNDALQQVIAGKQLLPHTIDEVELVRDVVFAAHERYKRNHSQ